MSCEIRSKMCVCQGVGGRLMCCVTDLVLFFNIFTQRCFGGLLILLHIKMYIYNIYIL
jgi:hypothetical protein